MRSTPDSSREENFESRRHGTDLENDPNPQAFNNLRMSGAEPDWYLREWCEHLGRKQAQLVTELGFTKNTAHKIWHSKQPYRRDIVNKIAGWLGIAPFELLMPPRDALALRRLRSTAAEIVASAAAEPSNAKKAG